ncbi:hypothetical protein Tsubulata_044864, partial [Turnera subulata]
MNIQLSHKIGFLVVIDEVWSSGPSIPPADPYDRAYARSWAAYLNVKFFPTVKSIAVALDDSGKSSLFKEVEEGLVLLEEAFKKCSKGKSFFGGDQIGYLDIALGGILGWMRVVERFDGVELFNDAKTPALLKWSQTFSSHPAVKDVMPDTDNLVDYAKDFVAKKRAAAAAAPPSLPLN